MFIGFSREFKKWSTGYMVVTEKAFSKDTMLNYPKMKETLEAFSGTSSDSKKKIKWHLFFEADTWLRVGMKEYHKHDRRGEKMKRAKVHNELKLSRKIKSSKEKFYKFISNKKTGENAGPLHTV